MGIMNLYYFVTESDLMSGLQLWLHHVSYTGLGSIITYYFFIT